VNQELKHRNPTNDTNLRTNFCEKNYNTSRSLPKYYLKKKRRQQ